MLCNYLVPGQNHKVFVFVAIKLDSLLTMSMSIYIAQSHEASLLHCVYSVVNKLVFNDPYRVPGSEDRPVANSRPLDPTNHSYTSIRNKELVSTRLSIYLHQYVLVCNVKPLCNTEIRLITEIVIIVVLTHTEP